GGAARGPAGRAGDGPPGRARGGPAMSRPATAVEAGASAGPTADPSVGSAPVRVALIGTHGFGGSHLRNLERLRSAGTAELIGVADPQEPPAEVAHLWH